MTPQAVVVEELSKLLSSYLEQVSQPDAVFVAALQLVRGEVMQRLDTANLHNRAADLLKFAQQAHPQATGFHELLREFREQLTAVHAALHADAE